MGEREAFEKYATETRLYDWNKDCITGINSFDREIERSMRRIDAALEKHPKTTKSIVEPKTKTTLQDAPDVSRIWVQRFCDLVGEDGLTENSRNEAFAKLYDAVKAARGG